MKHTYSITAINNTVGIPPTADGVMMIFAQAVAVAGTFALDTAYLLTSPDDLDALGIDAAYDVTNETAVFQQVNEFYAQAGIGALCWLVGVDMDTEYATYVASPTFSALIRFTGQADPLNRAKMIGLTYAPPQALQQATDFPPDVYATLTAFQTVQQSLFQQGTCICAILDGYNMSSTVAPSAITTQQTNSAFSIALCVTGTQPNGVSAVGLALGRFARISIGHGCGEVDDGGMNTTTAFLTNSITVLPAGLLVVGHVYTVFGGAITYNAVVYPVGAVFTAVNGHTAFTTTAGGYLADNCHSIQSLTPGSIDQLGQKQLFFLRTWTDNAGFYWNDGATCTSETKAFSSLEYNRVINNLAAAALAYLIKNGQGKNLPLQKGTPDVADGWLLANNALFYTQSIEPLNEDSGTGDITDGSLTITGTNFFATKRLGFKLKVIPTVIMGGADGTVEFGTTL